MTAAEAYQKGMYYWEKKNHVKAKPLLALALNDERYKNLITKLLFISEIRDGNFAYAREFLEQYLCAGDPLYYMLRGYIEEIENNFAKSKECYSMCMEIPRLQIKSLLKISKIYVQLGDYDIARKMLETVSRYGDFYSRGIFDLAESYIIEKDYEMAYKILQTINLNDLNAQALQNYELMSKMLEFYLGKIHHYNKNDYVMKCLMDPKDSDLIRHLRRHCFYNGMRTNGCFKLGIDFENLLEKVRERMKTLNPNHFQMSDMYRFKLDEPIGYYGNVKTNDVCVTTVVGTQNIITMYPVILSDKFDIEKMGESEELRLKRALGGKR